MTFFSLSFLLFLSFVFELFTFLCLFPCLLEMRGLGYTIDWIGWDSLRLRLIFLHMLCHFEGNNLDNRCFSDVGRDDRRLLVFI
ncbi:hypothetical protein BJX62DRAFT_192129 [Aspergillus germanicus]